MTNHYHYFWLPGAAIFFGESMTDDETTPFRPDGKIFASNAKTGEVEDFPDLERGWGVTFELTTGKPPMEWFNDITKRADLNLQYQKKTGQLSKFDQEYCDFIGGYPKGAVLLSDDEESSYISLVDNNMSNFNNDNEAATEKKWMKWTSADMSGVPIGTVEYFAMATPPAGYLKADGAAVGRATYPDLFAAIGTTFGAGDGETTFNLPDMIGRFAEGSATPGAVKEAGLPNITGEINGHFGSSVAFGTGSLFTSISGSRYRATPDGTGGEAFFAAFISASRSSPIYGNSDTVQPPALTLLPCIKAFDAAVNPGLIDVTELAQEIAGKVDRVINGKNIAYIVDSYNDMKGNWWREWSDGWLEQGGLKRGNGVYAKVTVNLLRPFSGPDYTLTTGSTIGGDAWYTNTASTAGQAATSDLAGCFTDKTINSFNIQGFSTHLWYACGVKGD